jgi:hypothetical protein
MLQEVLRLARDAKERGLTKVVVLLRLLLPCGTGMMMLYKIRQEDRRRARERMSADWVVFREVHSYRSCELPYRGFELCEAEY